MLETYTIPAENMGKLLAKLAKLNKQASKLGVEEIGYSVSDPILDTNERTGEVSKSFEVTIAGESPKFAGWTFQATLQFLHGEEKGLIIRTVPGMRVPTSFRERTDAWCDHCRTIRTRKDTYVVVNEAGEYKEVGSSCIRDFLGHGSPHNVASRLEFFYEIDRSMKEFEEYGSGTGASYKYTDISHYLPYAAQAVLSYGWVSAAKSQEWERPRTSSIAWGHFSDHRRGCKCKPGNHQAELDPTPRANEIANAVIEAVATVDTDGDWGYNLRTIFTARIMEDRNAGLVTSAVLLYFKPVWDSERKEKEDTAAAESVSEHLGEIGTRMTVGRVSLHSSFPQYTDFGVSFILKFIDEAGNNLVWFSSKEYEIGEYTMVGTIKRHGEYKGIKETAVNRCKLVEVA